MLSKMGPFSLLAQSHVFGNPLKEHGSAHTGKVQHWSHRSSLIPGGEQAGELCVHYLLPKGSFPWVLEWFGSPGSHPRSLLSAFPGFNLAVTDFKKSVLLTYHCIELKALSGWFTIF